VWSVVVGVQNQPPVGLTRMISQELLTPGTATTTLPTDADWVEKTMCFNPEEVPPWLKLKDGFFNVAPEINCRLHYVAVRDGNCYKLALLGCLHGGQDWTLVHGETVGPGGIGRMEHAWLEREGWVYDPVLDRVWPWQIYVKFVGAVSMFRYSYPETFRHLDVSGHCGPW
jgi:hypothetical protein